MKIRVYCEMFVDGVEDGRKWKSCWHMYGYISSPCLPTEGSQIWFLKDICLGASPAVVRFNNEYHETKEGRLEPMIHMDWEMGEYIPNDATPKKAWKFFKKKILPGLRRRGWILPDKPHRVHVE